MVFSDLFFLFAFLPAFMVCYALASWVDGKAATYNGVKSHLGRNIVLVIFSLIFYAWGEPVYVFLMLLLVLANYLAGLAMAKWEGWRRMWLLVGIGVDLASLCTFKYLNFFAEILQSLGLDVESPNIALPIGISFYVFQSISYLVDVYRREAPVQKSYGGLLLYISMFPQLIAGPIVRYDTVAREIHDRHVTAKDISEGVFRFLIGLGKKVIIANQLSEVSKQFLDGDLGAQTVGGVWIGIIAFTLQIYFDFSGYSDMAIGIGRCLGFHFNENFDHPYCSKTITEFWRRWHMSLGSFFRDYVYIPLGGNRKRQLLNILIVWFLTGMWHGASWNFILWGLYFGLILLVEKHTIMRIHEKIPAPLLHLYAVIIVTLGWVLFYFDDTGRMWQALLTMFGGAGAEVWSFADSNVLFEKFWLWLAAILLCTPIRRGLQSLADKTLTVGSVYHTGAVSTARVVTSVFILFVAVALLIGATNNAFLYTRF